MADIESANACPNHAKQRHRLTSSRNTGSFKMTIAVSLVQEKVFIAQTTDIQLYTPWFIVTVHGHGSFKT